MINEVQNVSKGGRLDDPLVPIQMVHIWPFKKD